MSWCSNLATKILKRYSGVGDAKIYWFLLGRHGMRMKEDMPFNHDVWDLITSGTIQDNFSHMPND